MAYAIPSPLRVVCTKCPAVAKVHHQELMLDQDSLLIWAECHGEHRLALVGAQIVLRVINIGSDVVFAGLEALEKPYLQSMYEETDARVQELAKRVALLQRFLTEAM